MSGSGRAAEDVLCTSCGRKIDPASEPYAYTTGGALVCMDCSTRPSTDSGTDPYAGLFASKPGSVIRTYHGQQQADAVTAFQWEAAAFAQRGYVPSSQSWAPGQWGAGAFVAAILLMFVLVGFLVFLYLLIVKPEGTLTVTYVRQAEEAPAPAPPDDTAVSPSLARRLAELDEAMSAGLISAEERASKRAAILERF